MVCLVAPIYWIPEQDEKVLFSLRAAGETVKGSDRGHVIIYDPCVSPEEVLLSVA